MVLAEENEGDGIKTLGLLNAKYNKKDDVEVDEVAARKHVPEGGEDDVLGGGDHGMRR